MDARWSLLFAVLGLTAAGVGQTSAAAGVEEKPAVAAAKVADSTRLAPMKITEAVWPEEAKAKGVKGTVVLNLHIAPTGEVEQADVVSGDPLLTQAAVDCAKQWRFQPYIKNGVPVKVLFRNAAIDVGSHNDAYKIGEMMSGISPKRFRISPEVAESLAIKKVNPVYPPIAVAAGVQGVVVFDVVLDKTGNPAKIHVVSGHPMLIQAAMNAVRQWRYKPYTLNGEPVEVDALVKVNFTLR